MKDGWFDKGFMFEVSFRTPLQLFNELLNQILDNNNVDAPRVYVTGLSMSGYATLKILHRKGKLFVAAMPVCGGGDLNFVIF